MLAIYVKSEDCFAVCRELTVHAGSGIGADESAAGTSPPAPALPPRRYRGEVDLAAVDRPPPAAASASGLADPTNGESTLPHDTYADQLRRQARRYQHGRGSSFSHPRPPPPDWKPPPPPPSLPPEPPPPPEFPAPPPSDNRSFEPEPWKFHAAEDAPSTDHVGESEVPGSWTGLTSSPGNHIAEFKPEQSSAIPDVQTPENRRTEVRQTTEDLSRSPRDGFFNSNSGGDREEEVGSSSSRIYQHPEVDVVSGYDRYYSIGDHTSTSLSRSFSSFIPFDGRSPVEGSCGRRSSQPALTKTSLPSDIIASAVDRPPRSPSASTNSDRSLQESGSVADNERRQPDVEVKVQSEATTSSEDPESFGNIEDGKRNQAELIVEPTLTEPKFHRRLTFPVEVDCARQAETVAGLVRRTDRDEALVNTLLVTASGQHRTAADFMAKVLGVVETERRQYDDFPEPLRLRLTARQSRHAAL